MTCKENCDCNKPKEYFGVFFDSYAMKITCLPAEQKDGKFIVKTTHGITEVAPWEIFLGKAAAKHAFNSIICDMVGEMEAIRRIVADASTDRDLLFHD